MTVLNFRARGDKSIQAIWRGWRWILWCSAAIVLFVLMVLALTFVSETDVHANPAAPPIANRGQLLLGGNERSGAPSGPVAYIYYTDTVSRDSFDTFLSARGFQVALVSLSAAETFSFSSYSTIVIGSDTGSFNSWGTPAAVSNINGSGKRVFGVGEGGYAFFGQLGLTTGYPNRMRSTSHAAYVLDPTQPFFKCPNPITIPPGRILTLYSTDVDDIEIYVSGTIPPGVSLIGSTPGDQTHYPLISQATGNQVYFLWGFSGAPPAMTSTGQDLFINVLDPPLCPQIYLPLVLRSP
jgi:hypothetical protein